MIDNNNLKEKNLEAMEEQLKKEAFGGSDNELFTNNQIEEESNSDDQEEENKENIEEDQNNEIVEYFLPTLEDKIIDSVLSGKNFFVNHLTKKIPDSESLIQMRQKLAIFDEYKDAIANESLRSNIYSDKLTFRNKNPEKISKEQLDIIKSPLMINSEQQLKDKTYLNKKISRENNNVQDITITSENISGNQTQFKTPLNKSITTPTNTLVLKDSEDKEKSALATIPEKYKIKETSEKSNDSLLNLNLDTESGKDSNLFLSLYRNKNHIAFRKNKLVTPEWHAPWKLYRVISGHNGWVRCIDVDPTNNWFVTGSNDRVIKFWDLASGKLKLSLTGHINTVRAVVVSNRHPYLFSAGEDKQVKCWDLEQNKVVRHYHGHLSGVHTLTLHPSIDVIITGGRDCVARVWDIRSKQQIMCLEGHNNTVSTVVSQEHNPQVITGSHDSTIKLWDLGSGKCMNTLTHHKKSIRSILIHESDYSFVSGGCDDIKVWQCPEGRYLRNMSGHNSIINSIALNKDNVLVSGGDEGSLYFWDYKSGYNFQKIQTTVQPGSLSSEAGIFNIKFDHSSTRMITAECDKTIKMWREDETATPKSHPIDF